MTCLLCSVSKLQRLIREKFCNSPPSLDVARGSAHGKAALGSGRRLASCLIVERNACYRNAIIANIFPVGAALLHVQYQTYDQTNEE